MGLGIRGVCRHYQLALGKQPLIFVFRYSLKCIAGYHTMITRFDDLNLDVFPLLSTELKPGLSGFSGLPKI